MKLIFVRHGLAEGHFSLNQYADFERVLTPEGIKRLNKTFRLFKQHESKIDVIFSSPLARAVQSAEIFWDFYKQADLELMAALDILDDPLHLV